MNEPYWPLSPRAARVFYNAADAWIPPGPDGAPGGGDRDLVAALRPLRPGERARLERALLLLEWSPRLALHSRRGLCWLPPDRRRAWLDRLEQRGPFRGAARLVHRAVDEAWSAAAAEP